MIDFRMVDDENVSGSGRRLIGTQAGFLMEIEKEATATDLSCHVFVIAGGIINVVENKLQGVEYWEGIKNFCNSLSYKNFEGVKEQRNDRRKHTISHARRHDSLRKDPLPFEMLEKHFKGHF